MKKIISISSLIIVLFAFGMAACSDDGPCDKLSDAMKDTVNEVCADFPDCSICDLDYTDTGYENLSDDQCQTLLDAWDHDLWVDTYTATCEQEETGTDASSGPCDKLVDAFMDVADEVCADFPDCSICDDSDDDSENLSDDECQKALDAWDHDAMIDLFTSMCEAEEAAA